MLALNIQLVREQLKLPRSMIGEFMLQLAFIQFIWKKEKLTILKLILKQSKKKQREFFLKQLNLAKELNLPVILHCRMAHNDLIQTIQQSNIPTMNGVIHCFTGDEEQAQKYLEMGLYFGFNGLIFKKIEGAPNWLKIIKELPLEKTLIETDAPYLTPPISINQRLDQRKSAVVRNEPLYVKYVAQKIAEVKNITFEKIAQITTQNAKELFQL